MQNSHKATLFPVKNAFYRNLYLSCFLKKLAVFMCSRVLAVLGNLYSIVGSLFVAVLQVGVFSFSIARMRSVGLRKIHKGFDFREFDFAESPGVFVEVDIPCPMPCWAVVGCLFVVNKD